MAEVVEHIHTSSSPMYSALCCPFHTTEPGGYSTDVSKSTIGHVPFAPPMR